MNGHDTLPHGLTVQHVPAQLVFLTDHRADLANCPVAESAHAADALGVSASMPLSTSSIADRLLIVAPIGSAFRGLSFHREKVVG
jgi:hypothetical protein